MYQKTKKHSLEGKKRATKCLQLLLRNQHIKLFYLMPEHRVLQDVQDYDKHRLNNSVLG